MSKRSENISDCQSTAQPIVALAKDYEPGERVAWHRHRRCQLIFAASGVMTVATRTGRWIIPPSRAVWVPANVVHSIQMSGTVRMRTLYLEPSSASGLPTTCEVVSVSPLLRELILESVKVPLDYLSESREGRLMRLILDELQIVRQLPLRLAYPKDARALVIARRVVHSPGIRRTASEWARTAGTTGRTLERLFSKDLGISFGRWCQQARLYASLSMVADGLQVVDIAIRLGYESPSAFSYAFKRSFGVSPSKYFSL
jgi:AraC-like DNA-binding protein